MIKLLWIDDNLDHDLTEKRMALYMEDDIDPHFARDATEAYLRLRDEYFDVVIVGLGIAGGCAAVSAAEAGARVLVLERAAAAGGADGMASRRPPASVSGSGASPA